MGDVENASYGLTICAERNGIFNMVRDGHLRIEAVAIYTPTPKPSAPCGACRQVINEELLYLVYTNINKEELERSLKTFYEYKRGERNPEYDVENPDEGHWDEAMAFMNVQDRMGR